MIKSNIKAGRPLETFCVRGKIYAKLQFYRKSGKEILSFKDPTEAIAKAELFIQKPFGICPECGKKFIKNGYTKREICEECYKKARRQNMKETKEKWRLTNRPPHKRYKKKNLVD